MNSGTSVAGYSVVEEVCFGVFFTVSKQMSARGRQLSQ